MVDHEILLQRLETSFGLSGSPLKLHAAAAKCTEVPKLEGARAPMPIAIGASVSKDLLQSIRFETRFLR